MANRKQGLSMNDPRHGQFRDGSRYYSDRQVQQRKAQELDRRFKKVVEDFARKMEQKKLAEERKKASSVDPKTSKEIEDNRRFSAENAENTSYTKGTGRKAVKRVGALFSLLGTAVSFVACTATPKETPIPVVQEVTPIVSYVEETPVYSSDYYLDLIQTHAGDFSYVGEIPPELANDPVFMLDVIKKGNFDYSIINGLSYKLFEDSSFVFELSSNPKFGWERIKSYVPNSMLKSEEFLNEAFSKASKTVCMDIYKQADEYDKAEIVLKAVDKLGRDALDKASDALFEDENFISQVFNKIGINALDYISSEDVLNDQTFMVNTIKRELFKISSSGFGYAMDCIDRNVSDSVAKGLLNNLARTYPMFFNYCVEHGEETSVLHNTSLEIIEEQKASEVNQNKTDSQSTNFNAIANDPDLMLEFLGDSANLSSISKISSPLWRNPDFMLEVLNVSPEAFSRILTQDRTLTNDPNFMLQAFSSNHDLSADLLKNSKLKSDGDFVLNLFEINPGMSAGVLSDISLFSDCDYILKIINICSEKSISDVLYSTMNCNNNSSNSDFVLSVFEARPDMTSETVTDVLRMARGLHKNKEFLLQLIEQNPGRDVSELLEFSSDLLMRDGNFVLDVFATRPDTSVDILKWSQYKNNADFMLQLIQQCPAERNPMELLSCSDLSRLFSDYRVIPDFLNSNPNVSNDILKYYYCHDADSMLKLIEQCPDRDIDELLEYAGDLMKYNPNFVSKVNQIKEQRILQTSGEEMNS